MEGPKLINSGKAAMEAVAKVLPTARAIVVPSNLGPVELKPGTVWSGNRMIVLPSTMSTIYVIDDRLYEWGTGAFIREEWLSAMAKGVTSAAHWVTVAQVEFALLSGIFVPWYLLLGLGCAKSALFYKSNQQAVDAAFRQAPEAMRLLQDLRRRCPTLFNKMASTAAKDLLTNLPQGVSGEDVAFFVGRVIKGVAGAGPDLVFSGFLKIALTVAGLVTATHLPFIAAHTAAHMAAAKAAELQRALQQAGYSVTESEAKTIMKEVLAQPDTPQKLRQLEAACKALLPTLNQLKNAYGVAH
jgi:hypothetical protein